jgi:phosphomannomutase/phosphoglucomutase
MNLNSFKAYGIRGRVPEELNEDLARRIGNATARLLGPAPMILDHDVGFDS